MSCGILSKRGERQANRQTGAEGERDTCMWMEERENLKERRSEKDGERENWTEQEAYVWV